MRCCLLEVPLAFNRQPIQSTGSRGWQRHFGLRSEALTPQSTLTLGDCHLKPGCKTASGKRTPNAPLIREETLCLNRLRHLNLRGYSQDPGISPGIRSTSFSWHEFYFQVKLSINFSRWGAVINFNCFHVSKQQKLGLISPITSYYTL